MKNLDSLNDTEKKKILQGRIKEWISSVEGIGRPLTLKEKVEAAMREWDSELDARHTKIEDSIRHGNWMILMWYTLKVVVYILLAAWLLIQIANTPIQQSAVHFFQIIH